MQEGFVEKPRFLKKEARILFSSIKEWNNDICNNINGPKSEVSQKEKDKCHMISLTCGIQKDDTGELIYKTATDSDTENTLMVNKQERKGEG